MIAMQQINLNTIFINNKFASQVMEAIIANFRGGKRTKYGNQMIVKIESVKNKDEAKRVIGKKVTWESPAGKKILGKVTNIHGNSGCVKVLFERGMPGQAISQRVKVE